MVEAGIDLKDAREAFADALAVGAAVGVDHSLRIRGDLSSVVAG